MRRTAFIFGRTPILSLVELQTFYPRAVEVAPGIAIVEEKIDSDKMIHTLGGSVKIVDIVSEPGVVSEEELISVLANAASGRKITFGISSYGSYRAKSTLTVSLKKQLVTRGYSVRYLEAKDEALTSVVVTKQQVIDVCIIGTANGVIIGKTLSVQDFEDWNARDFGRPAPDPKAGMLPPKVARMIVNIVQGVDRSGRHAMIADPFCGVGTILQEAALLGCSVTGSDISVDAVKRSKTNMEWLHRTYPETAMLFANIFVADATHLSAHVAPASIDFVVTEPYMGETVGDDRRSLLTPERVKNILKGLEKLYIGSLKDWHPLLVDDARVVMAMPVYALRRGMMRVKNVIDRCESLGYTLLTGPIEYSRPQAVVRREFYIFQKR